MARSKMSNHDYSISVFVIDCFDQLQDFLGGVVVQSAGRLITKQDIRIFYNGTSNSSSLLLTSRSWFGSFR